MPMTDLEAFDILAAEDVARSRTPIGLLKVRLNGLEFEARQTVAEVETARRRLGELEERVRDIERQKVEMLAAIAKLEA